MGQPPWLVLDPAGLLHFCHDKGALDAIAEANRMKKFNLYLLVGYEDESGKVTQGNTEAPEHVRGWTGLIRLRWLVHHESGRIVYVHGPSKAWREMANASSAEWAKDINNFSKDFGSVLTGKYKGGGAPYKGWSLLEAAPWDAVARLRHVMSGRYAAGPALPINTAPLAAAPAAASAEFAVDDFEAFDAALENLDLLAAEPAATSEQLRAPFRAPPSRASRPSRTLWIRTRRLQMSAQIAFCARAHGRKRLLVPSLPLVGAHAPSERPGRRTAVGQCSRF